MSVQLGKGVGTALEVTEAKPLEQTQATHATDATPAAEPFDVGQSGPRKDDMAVLKAKEKELKLPVALKASGKGEKVLGHRVATDKATGERLMFFWRTESPFSQWHPADFSYGGQKFVTSEQWMMALKARVFDDRETLQKILSETDPKKQKELGRQVKGFDAEKWNALSFAAVYLGNALKFSDALKERLLETRGYTLVEASPHDTIWGIGLGEEALEASSRKTWKGTNRLGQVLSELRDDMESGKVEARMAEFIAQLGIQRW